MKQPFAYSASDGAAYEVFLDRWTVRAAYLSGAPDGLRPLVAAVRAEV